MNLRFVRGFRDYVNRTGTTTVDGPPLQVRPRLEEIFQAVVLGLHQKRTHIHTYTHTLSHALRRSTISATALNGRVRDGIGCFAGAMITKPRKD